MKKKTLSIVKDGTKRRYVYFMRMIYPTYETVEILNAISKGRQGHFVSACIETIPAKILLTLIEQRNKPLLEKLLNQVSNHVKNHYRLGFILSYKAKNRYEAIDRHMKSDFVNLAIQHCRKEVLELFLD